MANFLRLITPLDNSSIYFKPPPMKTKLLKRIRKQYSYYLNDNGDYVVIDHYSRLVIVMDLIYFVRKYQGSSAKDIQDNLEPFYELKKYFLGKYGYEKNRSIYRKAILNYKRYMNDFRNNINISDAK